MAIEEKISCTTHPQEEASLTCGKCGKSICTICMTLTGEGVRCRECMAQLNARYAESASQNAGGNWTREPQQVVIPVEAQATPQTENSEPQLIDINPVTGEPSTDITYCRRHPKIETGLRCARCNTPICPRCMVYSSVGLRCPDCATNPQPSVKVNPGPYANSGPAAQHDTGFRTYWRRTTPQYLVQPQDYVRATVAAIGAALLGGLIWGFLLDVELSAIRGPVSGFVSSIHFVPEILLGVLVGSAVARGSKDKRGGGLQLVAIAGVFLSYLVAVATLITRVAFLKGIGFPPLAELLNVTWRTFSGLFNTGGTGSSFTILLFFILGGVFAWLRLKR